MKRSKFMQEQIIGVLKEHQAGATAADLCRKHGISDATFYTSRTKYSGMDVSYARKLKGSRKRTPSSRSCWRSRCWMWQR